MFGGESFLQKKTVKPPNIFHPVSKLSLSSSRRHRKIHHTVMFRWNFGSMVSFTIDLNCNWQNDVTDNLDLSPHPGCWLVTTRMRTFFRIGNPNLNLHFATMASWVGGARSKMSLITRPRCGSVDRWPSVSPLQS